MFPVACFGNEGHGGGPATAEQDGRDWHALGIFPLGGDRRTLGGADGEPGVGMSGRCLGLRRPHFASPVGEARWWIFGETLPPDVAIGGLGNVCEDAVARQRCESVGVCVLAGARSDAKEASLGIDGVELAVVAELHPGDVVTDGLDLPPWKAGDHHGHVGLAAS